jgi:hypothetical protein
MSEISMITPVTLETVQEYAVNDGMMCILTAEDVTAFRACKTAEEAIALISGKQDQWLGGTSGTTDITEGRESWSPEHNGLRLPLMGAQFPSTAKPSIKTKLVQFKPKNIAMASGGADIEGENTKAVWIKPRMAFKLSDYHTVLWFTNHGNDGIIGTILYNALCTTGLKWQVGDKQIGTCDVEFLGHAGSVTENNYLPMEHFIIKSSGAAA